MRTIIRASSGPITRAPTASILVSLWRRDSSAEYGSLHTTQRIPLTLLAASDIPTPVPQIKIPRSHSPLVTALAARAAITG